MLTVKNGTYVDRRSEYSCTWFIIHDPIAVAHHKAKPILSIGSSEELEAQFTIPGQHTIMCRRKFVGLNTRKIMDSKAQATEDLMFFSYPIQAGKAWSILPLDENSKYGGLTDPEAGLKANQRSIDDLKKVTKNTKMDPDIREKNTKEIEQLEAGIVRLKKLLDNSKGKRRYPINAIASTVADSQTIPLRAFLYKKGVDENLIGNDDQVWVIAEWTDCTSTAFYGEFEGKGTTDYDAICDAISEWGDESQMPESSIVCNVSVPDKNIEWKGELHTSGGSTLDALSNGLFWISLAGTVLLFVPVPGSRVASAYIFATVATTGAASSGINMYQRYQKGFSNYTDDGLDTLAIASNLCGLGWLARAKISSKLNLTASASNQASLKVGQYMLYGQISSDVLSGVLLTATAAEEIQAIIDNPRLTASEKIKAVALIIGPLAAQSALTVVSFKGTKEELAKLEAGEEVELDELKITQSSNTAAGRQESTVTQQVVNRDIEGASSSNASSDASAGNKPGDNADAAETTGASGPPSSKIDTGGEPISMITGEEILPLQDFTLPGPLPFVWQRLYRSSFSEYDRGLGYGWASPVGQQLRIQHDAIHYEDNEGRIVYFMPIEVGEQCRNRSEQLTLTRHDEHHYSVAPSSGIGLHQHFERVDVTGSVYHLVLQVQGTQAIAFYYHQAQLVSIVSGRHALQLEYDSDGHIIKLKQLLPDEQWRDVMAYEYNNGDLVAAIDAQGHRETYAYENHVITQRTLKSGYSFYFEWDQCSPKARCLRNWGDHINGQATYDYHFQWWPERRESQVTDTRGATIFYRMNESGQPLLIRDAEGGETHHQYDVDGNKISTTDPQGHTEYFHYNEQGHLTKFTNKQGHSHYFVLNEHGQATRVILPNGRVWQRRYSEQGQLTQVIDPQGNTTHYRYHEQGPLAAITNALGQTFTYVWNDQQQLLAVRNPKGGHTRYSYNEQGLVSRIKKPDGQSTRYQYNELGLCISVTQANGEQTHYAYTPLGLLETITDAAGHQTRYEYNGLSQVAKRIHPNGQSLHYHYDGERNLIGLTNENGEHYRLDYDLNERLVREIGFDGRHQTYEYNAAGQLVARQARDHEGKLLSETRYQRGANGELLKQYNSDGRETQFGYDTDGRLTRADNGERRLTWSYNELGLLTESTQDDYRLQYHYNALGQCQGLSLPNGHQITYQFDELGAFSGLQYQEHMVAELHRDDGGREFLRRHGNQLETQSHYDPQGRLRAQTTLKQRYVKHNAITPISQRQYHYNTQGQLSQIDDEIRGTTQYHYDALNRLTQVNGPQPERFVFDPANNLLAMGEDDGAVVEQQANQVQGNRLRFQGDTHYQYDSHGNRIESARGKNQRIKTRYTYNAQQQLAAIDVNGRQTTYHYDALGRRTRKVSAETVTEFYWDGDVLLGERTEHSQDGEINSNEKLYLFEPGTFKPMAMVQHGKVYHYHLDHLGTPQEITNSQGQLVWAGQFKAYGNLALKRVNEIENNLRFQGQYFDEESGLHYNRHRYYDPSCGQFITQDPIGLLGGANNYQYVPNPTSWVDPLGLTAAKEAADRTQATLMQTQNQTVPPYAPKTDDVFIIDKTGRQIFLEPNMGPIMRGIAVPAGQDPLEFLKTIKNEGGGTQYGDLFDISVQVEPGTYPHLKDRNGLTGATDSKRVAQEFALKDGDAKEGIVLTLKDEPNYNVADAYEQAQKPQPFSTERESSIKQGWDWANVNSAEIVENKGTVNFGGEARLKVRTKEELNKDDLDKL